VYSYTLYSDASIIEKRRSILDVGKIILKTWTFLNNRQMSVMLESVDSSEQSEGHNSQSW
jgi:hypothetical protein